MSARKISVEENVKFDDDLFVLKKTRILIMKKGLKI